LKEKYMAGGANLDRIVIQRWKTQKKQGESIKKSILPAFFYQQTLEENGGRQTGKVTVPAPVFC
jgi:hypothetical protein